MPAIGCGRRDELATRLAETADRAQPGDLLPLALARSGRLAVEKHVAWEILAAWREPANARESAAGREAVSTMAASASSAASGPASTRP
jgi:hypothetical protein